MPRELWWATLNERSERYSIWRHVLGSDKVPLASPASARASLAGVETEVYPLDLKALKPDQIVRLQTWVSERFKVSMDEAAGELLQNGFPIRAEDVIVAFDLRAFI